MTTRVNTYYGNPGDPFPDDDAEVVLFFRSDGHDFVKQNGTWSERKKDDPFERAKNPDGSTVVVVENLRVTGSFASEEMSYQSLNGMNGALMIAPSGRVKNISKVADHLLPTAKSFDPDYTTDTQTTFRGSVQPNDNGIVRYWFEYKSIADGISITTGVKMVTGIGVFAVSEVVNNLSPRKQYEVILRLEWKTGDYRSNAVRFTTLPPRTIPAPDPVVVTLDATTIAMHSAHLSGLVSKKSVPLTAYFKVWTSNGAYELQTSAIAVPSGALTPITSDITNLKSGVAYYCALCVSDGTKTWEGTQVQFSTLADTGELKQPTAGIVAVSAIGAEGATFTASLWPNGRAVSYKLEWWSGVSVIMESVLLTSSATTVVTVSRTTTNLKPKRQYQVQLSVYYEDASGPYGATEVIKLTGGTTQFTTLED